MKDKYYAFSKQIYAIILISMLFALLGSPAYADTGPHPSVTVTFSDLPECVRYATLLADKESYGPFHTVENPGARSHNEEEYRASVAFFEYATQKGYFYWGNLFEIKDGSFRWGYYPPERFIILLYDEASGAVYASDETDRFAFDSFYRVTILEDGSLGVEKESHLFETIYNVSVRVVNTLFVEILVALVFGYRAKREILIIVIANVLTQAFLNWYLIVDNYHPDTAPWFLLLLLMEPIIFIGEAVVYAKFLKSHSKKRAVFYAITANTVSLLSGVLIGGILM